MTAPAEIAPDARAEQLPHPQDSAPIRLVLAVEGIDTSDGRYIEPGGLSTRPMPLTVYAQVRSTHGLDGDAATFVVGAITEAERVDGPSVVQRSTGEPFPEGTAVWLGRGWMYTDVPTPESGSKPAYTLMKDGALYGNSVDLTAVDASFEYDDDEAADARRIVMHTGVIGSTTLVGIPAFMDAFVEVDGEPVVANTEALAALAASAHRIPSWRSPDVGDACGPCLAAATPPGDIALSVSLADAPQGDDIDPAALDFTTSGMVALVPQNPQILVAPGGDPADQLHMTLAYLGDSVDEWEPEQVAAVHRVALELTDRAAQVAAEDAAALERGDDPQTSSDVRGYKGPGQKGPLTAEVFAHAVFNPNGGPDGQEPATVYLVQGPGDYGDIAELQSATCYQLRDTLGTATFPDQHAQWVAHITAGYNLPADQLTYTGPITFDRLRVAIGNAVTDYPLGGGEPVRALAAAGTELPPADWFANPCLDGPTPITVTEEGQVFGHLATWGTCHIGFAGQCVTPPRSASSYAYFAVHSTQAVDANGNTVVIPVGYGTLPLSATSDGHADMRASAAQAARHYDNTCTAAFELAAGEDDYGIWLAGRLLPGLDELTAHRARGVAFSGDWRTIRGNLELVASLGVNTPGFPIPRVRVASGTPVALVAAAPPAAPVLAGRAAAAELFADIDPAEFRRVLDFVNAQALAAERDRAAAALAEVIAAPLRHDVLVAEATLAMALNPDHPWWSAELDDTATFAKGKGPLPLPPYIKRIAKHLQEGGMEKGHAIAAARNAADKMCETGDLNFPGHQEVNAGSRAEACEAMAQWRADRPGAKK